MTAPAFRLRNCDTSRGLVAGTEAAAEFYHPILPVMLVPAAGFLLILNGVNLNRVMADTVGYDGTAATAVQLLQMRAPREPLAPLLSMPGSGRVFRSGAKWRYRWRDSRTGVFSGLSPTPDFSFEMGFATPLGSSTYLGQTAYFNLATASKPPSADTIDLFANTAQEDDVWYLADSKAVGSASYVLLTDDNTDEELFDRPYVVVNTPSALPAGPTWPEGVMSPYAKAWQHPTARTAYFGVRRMGRFGPLAVGVSVTQGSDLVTVVASSTLQRLVEPGRVNQRVRFYSALTSPPTEVNDQTVYRLVKGESATTFRVWPEVQASTELALGASATWYFAIEDDRPLNWTQFSEPNLPWLVDPLKTLVAGDDADDGVLHWFTTPGTGDLNSSTGTGRVWMQTRRRIYSTTGSVISGGAVSDNPAASTLFAVAAGEGTVGLWSGCETPAGWAFWHEERGARIFDGVACRPLERVADAYGEALAKDQVATFEPSMLEDVRAVYDEANRVVVFSFVPTGGSTLSRTMTFSMPDRNWRGPNRDVVVAAGKVRSSASCDVLVVGDADGNLLTRQSQALDVTPTLPSFAGTGTISSVQTKRVFTDADAHFAQNSDETARGSPVWFSDGTWLYFARIVDVLSDTQVELDGPPVREDGAAATLTAFWTYGLGSLRWSATSGYIDAGGNPCHPIEGFHLNVRTRRTASTDSFECGASEDANGTFAGVSVSYGSQAVVPVAASGQVQARMRLKRRGSLLQLRIRGLARGSDPEIARAMLVAEEFDKERAT